MNFGGGIKHGASNKINKKGPISSLLYHYSRVYMKTRCMELKGKALPKWHVP
jgi:hypothetical protein